MRHGDGLMGMQALGPGSVDHVIADPPYSEHTHAKQRRDFATTDVTDLGFASLSDDTRDIAAAQFARLSRRWVLVFSDAEGIHGWRTALIGAGLDVVRIGAWVKADAPPQFTGDRPAQGWEAIVIAHRPGRKRWNGGGRHAVWTCGVERVERLHTTQKPLSLMEALVRDFTDVGDTILDPFAGSGTTLVAAKRNGRHALGWEMQEKYANAARRRLAATQEQMTLGLAAEPV